MNIEKLFFSAERLAAIKDCSRLTRKAAKLDPRLGGIAKREINKIRKALMGCHEERVQALRECLADVERKQFAVDE